MKKTNRIKTGEGKENSAGNIKCLLCDELIGNNKHKCPITDNNSSSGNSGNVNRHGTLGNGITPGVETDNSFKEVDERFFKIYSIRHTGEYSEQIIPNNENKQPILNFLHQELTQARKEEREKLRNL